LPSTGSCAASLENNAQYPIEPEDQEQDREDDRNDQPDGLSQVPIAAFIRWIAAGKSSFMKQAPAEHLK
jgi:hypothetical protein